MIVNITVPEVGESITEGLIAAWLKEDGDQVQAGEEVFELETDKITLAVTAEESGRLRLLVPEGETVKVGQVVGTLDTAASAVAEEPAQAVATEDVPMSPAVRRLVSEHDLDPVAIAGSGRDGRLTKADVLDFLDQRGAAAPAPTKGPDAAPLPPVELAPPAQRIPAPEDSERETRTPMSPLRRRIAERLLQAQQSAAILSTFNEADMSRVLDYRARHKASFEKRHGVRLGFMSFFVKAVVDALKTVPQVNARIEGDDIIQQHYHDIGVAVGTENGLVVPIIRDADSLGFADIERQIADFADRARRRRLSLDELSGGSYTISNGGVYGSLLSTPIINPPQSGILGLHSIQKRPVATEDDQVVVRPMMYLAMSYDHRLIDGSQAVTFLKRVKECIEDPERMLLEV